MHLHHSLSFGSDFASDLSLRELALKMIADGERSKQKQNQSYRGAGDGGIKQTNKQTNKKDFTLSVQVS